MAIITIYSLFGDDVRQLAFTLPADIYFYGITLACMFFFTLEIVLSSLVKENYFLGFYFWLDIIATASLIFDLGWIQNLISGYGANGSTTASTSVNKASKGARASTQASRVTRVIRLVRLIRIVKLYKTA
jgi:hypothetical protein